MNIKGQTTKPSTIPRKSGAENLEIASRIIAEIVKRFGVTPVQLESASRAWKFTYPRWLAISVIRSYTSFSLSAIGLLFNRDNATVCHAITGLHDEISTNPQARQDWDSLCALFP